MYRIIIPLDGSELSEGALSTGSALARALGGFIVLTHIADGLQAFETSRLPEPEEDDRLAYLKRVAATFPDDLDVAMSVSGGEAADEIIRISSELPKTIIVMSTHGRGGLGRLVFGSVADKVMRRATAPVLVVPAGTEPRSPALRNLLVPLDGSELAEAALPLAVEIARGSGATLYLIRVVEPFWSRPTTARGGAAAYLTSEQTADLDHEQASKAHRYLARVARDIEEQGVIPQWSARHAKPVDGIAEAAREWDVDLILLSSHGLGGLKRWAFGSVATEIIHRKMTPVMVLPSAAVAERTGEPVAEPVT